MASLESLSNPLERLVILNTTMSFRTQATGDTVWDVLQQYYLNDVVFSSVDGGAYIWLGGPDFRTTVRGGDDPSVAGSGWAALSAEYVTQSSVIQPTVGTPAANVIPLTTNAVTVPDGSWWQVSVQATCTASQALVAGDVVTFTLTASGTGASSKSWDVVPIVDAATVSTDWGAAGLVIAGTGGTTGQTLTLTATYAQALQTPTNVAVVLIRVL
jgi:hypothetical protein